MTFDRSCWLFCHLGIMLCYTKVNNVFIGWNYYYIYIYYFLQMDQLNNLKMLVLGDFHLNKTKHIIEKVEKGTIIPIAKWKCSNWALIKDAKKEYFKYKKDSGCPDIVVLSVGNNDLLKVSSEHLIMTSLLRLANLLHKDGVKIVVLFSLVERNIPVGPYNQQVEKINKVLERKAKKLDWLFFFKLWETTKFLGTVCLLKGFHLPNTEHKRLASLLQNLYFKPDIKKILKDNRDVSEVII